MPSHWFIAAYRLVNFSGLFHRLGDRLRIWEMREKSWTTARGTLIDRRPWHVLWLLVASQCQNNYRRKPTAAKWLGTDLILLNVIARHTLAQSAITYERELIGRVPFILSPLTGKEGDTWKKKKKKNAILRDHERSLSERGISRRPTSFLAPPDFHG